MLYLIGLCCVFLDTFCQVLSASCGSTITKSTLSQGSFVSQGYPSPTKAVVECEWIISGPTGTKVEVLVEDMQVRSYPPNLCVYANNEIHFDDTPNWSLSLCGGATDLGNFTSTDNIFRLYYKRDTKSYRGIKVKYYIVPQNTCNTVTHTAITGTVTSYNYPLYTNNIDCKTIITWVAGSGAVVEATFVVFDLKTGFRGNTDCIYIYNGPDTTSPLLASECGDTASITFVKSTTYAMTIRLKTDYVFQSSGYKAHYVIIPLELADVHQSIQVGNGPVYGDRVMSVLLDGSITTCTTVRSLAENETQNCGHQACNSIPFMGSYGVKLRLKNKKTHASGKVNVKITVNGTSIDDCNWPHVKVFANLEFDKTCPNTGDLFSICSHQPSSSVLRSNDYVTCIFTCPNFKVLHVIKSEYRYTSFSLCEIQY